MDWEAGEVVEREIDKFKRWIKESIHIRTLSPIRNQLISTPNQGGGGTSTE